MSTTRARLCFQKLIASRVHDHHGLALAGTFFEFAPAEVAQQYLRPALTLCFQRMQTAPSPKFRYA